MARSRIPRLAAWRLEQWLATAPRIWPALVVLLAAAAFAGCRYEALWAGPPLTYLGEPRLQDWRKPLTWNRTLRNHGFMVGYSDLRGNPLWVSYRLTPPPASHTDFQRPSRFRTDWRGLTRIAHDDYRDSGYDRGHMAPNHAIGLLYGREAQLDTFLMTNVVPQKPALNRELWERLEEAELDHFAARHGTVWVLTGPIFDDDMARLRSAWRVEIPDAFYKIYAAPGADGPPSLLAFVMPQQVRGDEPLDRYLASVDRVEQLTGLDFFPELPEPLAQKAESETDARPWDLAAVSHRPGRHSTHKRLEPYAP